MQHELFRVHITGKDGAAKRCHLGGDYQLVVKDSSLCLCGVKLNQVIYEWPYTRIRCYGYTDKTFDFSVGRFCCSGEGMFSIKTKDGLPIYKSVHGKVQVMKKDKDVKHHRRIIHRSEPLLLPARVHRCHKKNRNMDVTDGCHGCEFVYSEPYSLSTRCVYSEPYSTSPSFTTCHDYMPMDGTTSATVAVAGAVAGDNDEYVELYDDCAVGNNEYTKLQPDNTKPYGNGVYEPLKPALPV
ncbi:uncharacterized protein [Haliotis asinina]|uniref:uncharacterized protein n=1 Tax=Haliotis asinina TaxID=109174 RepID=UPI0035322B88